MNKINWETYFYLDRCGGKNVKRSSSKIILPKTQMAKC